MKTIPTLTAVSPIDGRYHNKTEALAGYFSEYALIKYRVKVEIDYFVALCQLPLPQLDGIDTTLLTDLQNIGTQFSVADAHQIKEIERVTNHDVKAVEYFLKDKLQALGLETYQEFIHFGLTSQDINNTAVPLSLKDAIEQAYLPLLESVTIHLAQLAKDWAKIPMLSRTHGQAASPTLLGKEIGIFHERLLNQIELLKTVPHTAKFGGAVGNLNAHYVAYPAIDWTTFARQFLEHMGLERQALTTQIDNYDHMAALFDAMKRINTILIDFCRDVWTYVSMDYFKQKIKKGEVGSSTMPHKVNPIDFENAEGNLGIANALFGHLANKLPISRLQRDLTDSTVSRNIGVPFGHTFIALKSIQKGLNKLLLNEAALQRDLSNNWAVIAEAIQTILRREQYPQPYETLKALTRTNTHITQERISQFIDTLSIDDVVKTELKQITPFNYVGKSF